MNNKYFSFINTYTIVWVLKFDMKSCCIYRFWTMNHCPGHCPKSIFAKKFFLQKRIFFTLNHLVGDFWKKMK